MTRSLWLGINCAGAKAVEALEHAIHHHIGQRLCDRRKTGGGDSGLLGKKRYGMGLTSGLPTASELLPIGFLFGSRNPCQHTR